LTRRWRGVSRWTWAWDDGTLVGDVAAVRIAGDVRRTGSGFDTAYRVPAGTALLVDADLALRSLAAFLVEQAPEVRFIGDIRRHHVEDFRT
jgi:hypothetical protein